MEINVLNPFIMKDPQSLFLLVKRGTVDDVVCVLENGMSVNAVSSKGNTLLHWAVMCDHLTIVEKLLHYGADGNLQNSHGDTSLHIAADRNESCAITEMLIEHRTNIHTINYIGETALYKAASNGNADIVRILIREGADYNMPTRDGNTPINGASYYGHLDTVQTLIGYRAKINLENNDKYAPIHRAAHGKDPKLVKILIDAGADVNMKASDEGYSTLHAAMYNQNEHIIKYLIGAGVDVNAQNINGSTPLHWAVSPPSGHCGDFGTITILLCAGADINLGDAYGNTPLHWAIRTLNYSNNPEEIEIIPFLANNGANVNAQDIDGETALHDAITYKNERLILKLLDVGADANIKNNKGNTPYDLLLQNGVKDNEIYKRLSHDYFPMIPKVALDSLLAECYSKNVQMGNTP